MSDINNDLLVYKNKKRIRSLNYFWSNYYTEEVGTGGWLSKKRAEEEDKHSLSVAVLSTAFTIWIVEETSITPGVTATIENNVTTVNRPRPKNFGRFII